MTLSIKQYSRNMLSVIMLSVVMPSVVMLSVVMPNVDPTTTLAYYDAEFVGAA